MADERETCQVSVLLRPRRSDLIKALTIVKSSFVNSAPVIESYPAATEEGSVWVTSLTCTAKFGTDADGNIIEITKDGCLCDKLKRQGLPPGSLAEKSCLKRQLPARSQHPVQPAAQNASL